MKTTNTALTGDPEQHRPALPEISLSVALPELMEASGRRPSYHVHKLPIGRLLGKVDAYFSSFRRCNYPRVSPQGVIEIVEECGRYSRFWDIPSPWWQASTVLVGTGSALSLLVAITATAACCITYVVHTGTARLAGALQLIAAVLVCGGAAVYPVGWDNREVKESCGNTSSVYRLGTCELSWSVYLLGSAVGLLLLCFGLSFCASRVKPGSFRI